MKKFISLMVVCAMAIMTVNAQENVDVKKETVTKKVTVNDGNIVETKVVDKVAEEKSVIVVEHNDQKEQQAMSVSHKVEKVEVVSDEIEDVDEDEDVMSDDADVQNADVQTQSTMVKPDVEAHDDQMTDNKNSKADVDASPDYMKKEKKEMKAAKEKKKKKVVKKIDN